MTGVEKLAELATWASKNAAYNLDFVPDDKLDWKPAPTANSALEVANHIIKSFHWVTGLVNGKESTSPTAATKEEAQKMLREGGEAFAKLLTGLKEDELKRMIELPWGAKMPLEEVVGLGAIDAIHHRAQICYIQTLLGDTQDHFEM